MRILIDVNHPAHVHLFRCAALEWILRGHDVFWTARDKDLVVALLRNYGFDFQVISTYRRGLAYMILDLMIRDWKLFRLVHRLRPDVMLGTSVNITHVSRVTSAHSIFFTDSDPHLIRPIASLSFPFADVIVTPDSIPDTAIKPRWQRKWVKFAGTQKLAYLHPNRFNPDPTVLEELKIDLDEPFFVLRFIAWGASHDLGEGGLNLESQRRIIHTLIPHGRVFITAENDLPPEFEPYLIPIAPYRIHDILYYATLFVGDSQSMTTEAALLGTPAIRCNSMVGRTAVIDQLEHKYDLAYGFLPNQIDWLLAKITELLMINNVKLRWREKLDRLLADKIDLTSWMVDFVEGYPDSLHKYQR
jgi:uncharacterized protein